MDDLIIKLKEPSGKIRGHELKSYKSEIFYGFENIPYAAPPIKENRFKVSEFKTSCLQTSLRIMDF